MLINIVKDDWWDASDVRSVVVSGAEIRVFFHKAIYDRDGNCAWSRTYKFSNDETAACAARWLAERVNGAMSEEEGEE